MTAVAGAATGFTEFGVVGCGGAVVVVVGCGGVVVVGGFVVVGCGGVVVVVGGFVGTVTGHTSEIGVGEVVPPAATVTSTVDAPGDATTVRCWLPAAEVTTPPVTLTW